MRSFIRKPPKKFHLRQALYLALLGFFFFVVANLLFLPNSNPKKWSYFRLSSSLIVTIAKTSNVKNLNKPEIDKLFLKSKVYGSK